MKGLHLIERKKINGFAEYLLWHNDTCLGVYLGKRRALRNYKKIKRKLDAGAEIETENIIAK